MNGGGAILGGSVRGASLIEAAAISIALLISFSASVRADENGAGPSHVADANRAVSSTPPGSNSSSAIQQTHSSAFDELPIKHHADDTATPAPSANGSGASPVSSAPSLEAPRVLLALALVVGLIFALRWAARRFFATPGATGGSGAVQVLSRSPLSPRQQVVLIKVGRRVLVVSDNGQQLSSLAEISEADEVAALMGQVRSNGTSPAKPFGNFFQRFTATAEAQAESRATQEADGNQTKLDISEDPAAVAATRAELGNLMEQVRLVSRELGRS